jgi:hypothetical protein
VIGGQGVLLRNLPRMRIVRRLSALLLAVSYVLPIGSCSSTSTHAVDAYPWPSVQAVITALLFLWPLAVELLVRPRRPLRVRGQVAVVAGCMATIGGIWLLGFVMANGPRYGAFVALGSVAVYASASLADSVRRRPDGIDDSG